VGFAVEGAARRSTWTTRRWTPDAHHAARGLATDSQTLCDQLDALARVLAPAHERLHAPVLSQSLIGVDETRWPLLGSDDAARWHAWGVATPHAVCYRITDPLAGRDVAGEELLGSGLARALGPARLEG
jgi:hypothetical protein